MRMSRYGVEKLAEWEGSIKRNGLHRPYDDATGKEVSYGDSVEGYLTIGYGHLLDRSELRSEVVLVGGVEYNYWDGLTEEVARELFDEDLDWAENAVNRHTRVQLNQNQFESLVSFTFNVGGSAFRTSTLLKLLNKGQYNEVPGQLSRWIRSGGVIMQGLINRRNHEIEHWNSNDSDGNAWRG